MNDRYVWTIYDVTIKKIFMYGYDRCQYKFNINISTFCVIYCYDMSNEDTLETKTSALVAI